MRALLAAIAVFYLFSLWYSGRASATLNGSDAWGHYLHLPALLLYHDTGDYTHSIAAWQKHYPTQPDPRSDAYGIRPTQSGKLAVKYPLGLALLETPFFAAAHLYCLVSGSFPADGFSPPYAWAISLSSLFFAVLGLFFLYKNLIFFFSKEVSLLVTTAVGLGTNLFFFVAYTPGMAHPAAFCLIACVVYATRHWHAEPGRRQALELGFLLGLIALLRTQDLIAAAIPALWGLRRLADLPARARQFWQQKKHLLLAAAAFTVTLLPQALYWKFVSGHWWHYGYQGETFNWTNPQIWSGLFSFQNGWLIYTPLMVLSVWGLWRTRRSPADWWWPVLVFWLVHVWVSYSWWCWMYINGFGSRPMVDAYALMAFPLAAWVSMQKKCWAIALAFSGLVLLNLFQTWQVQRGLLWSERGNWAHCKEIFGRTRSSERALAAFESGEVQPPEMLQFSRTLAAERALPEKTGMVVLEGHVAFPCREEFNLTRRVGNDTARLFPGDWLRVSAKAFLPSTGARRSVDAMAKLVIDFTNPDGQILKYRAINVGTHIGNPDFVLWKTSGSDLWGEASFFVMAPMGFTPECSLKIYLWNPQKQEIYLEELRLEIWRS